MPKVSIIVPVYNTDKYLHQCLDSILTQTFTDFEAILVDDGSTDRSGIICDEYSAIDSRFVVVHKQNEGVAKARITAFEHSKGNYIAFIDSDDFVNDHYLETMMRTAEKYHVDMVSCQYYVYEEGRTRTIHREVNGYYDKSEIERMLKTQFLYDKNTRCAGIPIMLYTKLVRRDYVADALSIGMGLKWSEDQLGLFHILMHINSLYVISDCLYYYVKHQEQVTNSYTADYFPHQLEAYRRYKIIDKKGYIDEQLHIRIWLFTIKAGLLKKMPLRIRDYSMFREEMKRIEAIPSWQVFFHKSSTGLNLRNDILYWILKLRFYRCFYLIFYKKRINR